MKKTKTTFLLLSCVIAAVVFCSPSVMVGYTLLGFGLSLGSSNYQRDMRVFDNFLDGSASNNTNPDANFPGALGAAQALWKGGVAWNSQSGGNRNFDLDWQGMANGIGGQNDNISSSLQANCGGGTLAFTEAPSSNGWRIRYCEEWTWSDGPGSTPSGQIDLQGVGAHEIGHAIGLGHTGNVNCNSGCAASSTMCPSICGRGDSARSIATDDRNGLTDIYGNIGGGKPVITGISGDFSTGGSLVIDGMNFAGSVNVKFTAGTGQNSGSIPGVVFGVNSTNGGTRVTVTIPASARTGNVFVWQPGNGGLSNYFPIPIDEVPPTISNIDPIMGEVRGNTVVTINGNGFQSGAVVTMTGEEIIPTSITGTEIVFRTPQGPSVGAMSDVMVSQFTGDTTLSNAYSYTENELAIEWSASGGQPSIGRNLNIEAYSTANKAIALAVALPGTTERQGLTFCVQLPAIALWKFSAGLNSGPQGQVSVQLQNLPGPAFVSYNITGVERTGPGVLTILDCETFTVFP